MKLVDVFVPGRARTKGSWGPLFIAGEGRAEWERQVAEATRADSVRRGHLPLADGPVFVSLAFFLPRKGDRTAPVGHQTGDIDKLTRLVLDALQKAGVYLDDSRVVQLRVDKAWAQDGIPPGVMIGVDTVSDDYAAWAVKATGWALQRQGLTEETGY